MDLVILTAIFGLLFIVLFIYNYSKKNAATTSNDVVNEDLAEEENVTENEVAKVEKITRILAVEKVGTKKRAKLEAKAEKKLQFERELRQREEDKKLQEERDRDERLKVEAERVEESKKLEELKRKLEEKQKRDQEEYLKLKESFIVEEEGCHDIENDANLLDRFIEFIKKRKIVVLEDLAFEFKLRTQDVINRIQELKDGHILPGVIDDRGKFIYISDNEWVAVADFIRKCGRISIADLTDYSSELIEIGDDSPSIS